MLVHCLPGKCNQVLKVTVVWQQYVYMRRRLNQLLLYVGNQTGKTERFAFVETVVFALHYIAVGLLYACPDALLEWVTVIDNQVR